MAYTEQDEITEFEHHAARAFFASAWADMMEENDEALQGEIMAQMPTEIDSAALHAARTLRLDMERVNGKPVSDMLGMIERDGDGDRDNTVEFFGHYAAMQAMGHGVGLGDAFGYDIHESIKVPYLEFGSHSLQKDYI